MTNRACAALTLSFLLLVCPAARAQKAASIGQLREQIRKMLAVDADNSTTPEVRSLNRELLRERRAQLRELLQQRLDALLKYRAELKDTMTPDLDGSLRKSIADVMAEIQEVSGGRRTATRGAARRPRAEASAVAAGRAQDADKEEDEEDAEDEEVEAKKVVVSTATVTPEETPVIAVRVTNPNVTKLHVTVKKGETTVDEKTGKDAVAVTGRGDDVYVPVRVKLAEGENVITVVGITNKDEEEAAAPVTVTRLAADATADAKDGAGGAADAKKSKIEIKDPKNKEIFRDNSLLDLKFTVKNPAEDKDKKVKEVFVAVLNKGLPVRQGKNSVAVEYENDEDLEADALTQVRVEKGTNEIRLFSNYVSGEPVDLTTVTVECRGDRCGAPVADDFANSLNMRAIIGFEQAGASSAESKSAPFLDMFFFGPLRYGNSCKGQPPQYVQERSVDSAGNPAVDDKGRPVFHYRVQYKDPEGCFPTWSTWGNVRLSSIPRQTSAFGSFASNFINPLAEGRLREDLVQGFNFLAGLDRFLFGTDRDFASPIPGFKHRTGVYLTAGFGAVSPLTPSLSADIRRIPVAGDPQRARFISEFPEADVPGARYIAFVDPERDKFLRQYYGGFRFKTHFIDRDGYLINRFPAILDVTFGQSEAVTGGKLTRKVFRLEAFYPFPIRAANFMYFYGSAFMKIGGGKSIRTPFALARPGDDADVDLTDQDVVITSRQLDRDFYRIGIGVNLTELFNRGSSPPR